MDRADNPPEPNLELTDVVTSLGRVPVWGSFNSQRPVVLVIRGAFADFDQLTDLDPPGADLVMAHLPGMHSAHLALTSVDAFAAAFDEVIGKLFAGREIIAIGLSVGALVALSLKAPEVRGVLAVEPFFTTAKLWPLVEWLRPQLADPAVAAWVKSIFGVTPAAVEDIDYSGVLARQDRPALALFGDVPLLPRRPVRGLPSLADDPDRLRIAHIVTPGGHAIPTPAIRAALSRLTAR